MAFTTSSQRDIERMMRKQMEEQEYRRMKEMYEYGGYGFTQSGSGAAEAVVAEPEKPKHLNTKLLLTKGA